MRKQENEKGLETGENEKGLETGENQKCLEICKIQHFPLRAERRRLSWSSVHQKGF